MREPFLVSTSPYPTTKADTLASNSYFTLLYYYYNHTPENVNPL